MSIIKFSEYVEEALSPDVILGEDEVIIEWSEEEWYKLSVAERAELEAEAIDGWSKWQIGEVDEDSELDEFKARNTQQRRQTQFKKDRLKHSDRQTKLKAKIDRKKGGNKVHRLKVRKKWQKINKSKIANAQKVYGGRVKSKFTKKK
tara:strand:- start:236 stop:676 length:441 start_codon:yes stop_codon:yes gene_type:complete